AKFLKIPKLPDLDWQNLSLRTVLIAVLIPVTLLPLIAFYIWSNQVALQRQVDDVSDRHLLIARNVGEALSRYHRDILSAYTILTQNVMQGRQIQSGAALLQNLSFRHLCIADAKSGKLVASISSETTPCPSKFPDERFALFTQIAKSSTPVMSGVEAGPGNEPTIFIVSRQDGLFAIGALKTDYFVELGKAISFGRKGHAAIVDHLGRVLWHPKPQWRKAMKNISKVPPVAAMVRGENGISQFYSPAVKADMIAGFTAVKGTGWGVMIPQPFVELEEAAAAANRAALLVLFIGFLVSVGIGTALAWRLTGPLSDVIGAARAMAEGGSGTPVIQRKRRFVPAEFNDLRDAFNSMAEAVEKSQQMEARLRQRAESANRAKTIFLASMSHELRTPLNAIIGFAEVLLKDDFDKIGKERCREYLEDILSGGQHLLDLINNILDLSRLELGETALHKANISLSRAIDRAVAMVRPIADGKRQELVVDGILEVALLADEMRFRQIIINLTSNSVQFTQDGGRIEVHSHETEDGGIAITVSDNGPGIDKKDLDRVLQPFQRGETEFTRGTYGIGLGLGIVASLVDAHGADFSLDSELGSGTTATITFPPDSVNAPTD
ncbi:MAG TPA: hypothetical protein DCE33_02150, partial [Rhodospirillaceae bacterium]|nr:hypothetical protein [Rhodospirillaceae bacterium]